MEPEHHLICKGKSSQPNLHDILQVPAVHFRLVYGKVAHYFGVLEVDVGFNKQQPTSNQQQQQQQRFRFYYNRNISQLQLQFHSDSVQCWCQ